MRDIVFRANSEPVFDGYAGVVVAQTAGGHRQFELYRSVGPHPNIGTAVDAAERGFLERLQEVMRPAVRPAVTVHRFDHDVPRLASKRDHRRVAWLSLDGASLESFTDEVTTTSTFEPPRVTALGPVTAATIDSDVAVTSWARTLAASWSSFDHGWPVEDVVVGIWPGPTVSVAFYGVCG